MFSETKWDYSTTRPYLRLLRIAHLPSHKEIPSGALLGTVVWNKLDIELAFWVDDA